MRVLVTEAGSEIAYHLVGLLATSDVIPDQCLELVLCDSPDKLDAVQGLVMELQDCVYPTLTDVSTTNDLCATLKRVDLAIMLPTESASRMSRDQCRKVQVSHTTLGQVNFRSLDGAFHPSSIDIKKMPTSSCHGHMSTAHMIEQCVREVFLKQAEHDLMNRLAIHEEAEFGICLDVPDDASTKRLSLMFVASSVDSPTSDKGTSYTLNCFVSRL